MKAFLRGIVLGLLLGAAYLFISGCTHKDYEVSYVERTVKPGVTVWAMAETYFDRQTKCVTMDEYMYDIKQANGWKVFPMLYPGDKVIFPIAKEKGRLQEASGKI